MHFLDVITVLTLFYDGQQMWSFG